MRFTSEKIKSKEDFDKMSDEFLKELQDNDEEGFEYDIVRLLSGNTIMRNCPKCEDRCICWQALYYEDFVQVEINKEKHTFDIFINDWCEPVVI